MPTPQPVGGIKDGATAARKIQRYGWRPDSPDHRDRVYTLERETLTAARLPKVFSLRGQMPPVYDQGQLGSCTGNGIAAVLEHAETIQSTPSRLFIYYGERKIEGTVSEDSGAQIRDGIKVVAKDGAPPETEWPYDIAKFAERPPPNVYLDAKQHEAIEYLRVLPGTPGSPIRTPIFKGHPVVFGFSVPERFESPTWHPATGLLPLPEPGEGIIGGHCVVCIGWDFSLTRFPVNVFEIRNSWGPSFGDQGHFWMDARWLYEPSLGLSSDLWVIDRAT